MTDRGVSVTVNYVLTIGITTLLITGLLFAVGDLVEDRRESTSRLELQVVGERIASDLMAADRLAQAGASEVIVRSPGPDRVAGDAYIISLNATSRQVVLEMPDSEMVVRVPLANSTPVGTSSTNGGDVHIFLNTSAGGRLEVRSS